MTWKAGPIWALIGVFLFGLLLPVPTARAEPTDFPIPNGHFFKQTNGANGTGNSGFAVADDGTARFWSEFQRLGGVAGVGYPVSQRFVWDGFPSQAFQKMVFQWRANEGRVYAVNVVDVMHDRDLDGWLLTVRSTPPIADWTSDTGRAWPEIVAAHQALLTDPDIWATYYAVDDPITLYGLPMAPIQDMGNVLVLRAQRGIIQKWLVDVPWASAGQVTVANSGDVAKEAGLLPAPALALQVWSGPPSPAEPPPNPSLSRVAPARTDGRAWRVVLDPGHGGSEVGSSQPLGGGYVLVEKNLNLQIAARTADLLRRAGVQVGLTRESDQQVNWQRYDHNRDGRITLSDDLQARVEVANQFGADIFVSIHNNGHSNPAQSGTEVYYNEARPFSGQSRALAWYLQQRLVQFIRQAGYPTLDRGIKTDLSAGHGGYFAVLGPQSAGIPSPTRMPAALTESLFVSSSYDGPWLARSEILEAIARGHVEGIIDYFEWALGQR